MPTQTKLVNGQDIITDQENALNALEQLLMARVTAYAKQTTGATPGTPRNAATLEDVPIGQQPHSLYLTAADTTADPAKVAPRQPGQPQVFHGIAYVSGVEKLVVGFRLP